MKGNQMTLKQAAKFLENTDYPFSHVTIRKAVMEGRLKGTLNTIPAPFYTVDEDDLIAWASDAMKHKPGRKAE